MKSTELQSAKLLLRRGVLVSVAAPLILRCLGKKVLKFSVKAPTAYQLTQIAELFLQMKVDLSKELSTTEVAEIYAEHHALLVKIIAISMLKSGAKNWQINWLAQRLYKTNTQEELNYLFRLLILHGGVQDFIHTIKLVSETRITKPMNLSQEVETS